MHIARLLAAVAAIAAFAATDASAATTCTPPGKQRSTDVARDSSADGSSEVTEFLARGEYRVTQCDPQGDLVVSQTVSPIRTPGGNVELVPTEIQKPEVTVSVLYGDPGDPEWATAFRKIRAPLTKATIEPTEPIEQTPVALIQTDAAVRSSDARPLGGMFAQAAGPSGDECTNPQFRTFGGTFKTRTYNYFVNRSTFNYNDATVAQIVLGHTNWDGTRNGCGLNDITNLTSHHVGSTSAVVNPDKPDGISVTDRGSMAGIEGCTIAIACTFNFPGLHNTVIETDQRFNSKYKFSNVGAPGRYDTQSIATHESGHSIGLDHADSSSALTMFFQVLTGTTRPRSLAKGDVRGLRARYP